MSGLTFLLRRSVITFKGNDIAGVCGAVVSVNIHVCTFYCDLNLYVSGISFARQYIRYTIGKVKNSQKRKEEFLFN